MEQGQKVKRLVPAGKVVPGNEVVWTITAVNVCKTPTDNVVVANPVPEQMTYVANSAMGTGTDIAYSLDGKEFKNAAELQVRAADGTHARRARRRVPRDPLDLQGRVRAGRDRVRALSRRRQVTVEPRDRYGPVRVWQGRATAPKFSLPMCVSLLEICK